LATFSQNNDDDMLYGANNRVNKFQVVAQLSIQHFNIKIRTCLGKRHKRQQLFRIPTTCPLTALSPLQKLHGMK
jgi:hypothetical protein